MLQRILAPTDGSPESEKAMPLAEQIALAHGAELILTLIIDQSGLLGRTPGAEAIEQEASAQLASLERRLRAAGVRTRSLLERGPTAATLLDREKAERPDLLVIATHGRTGLARFAMGSVADRMVREGLAPVLVVRRTTEATVRLETAIVLLDGSQFGEAALMFAKELAGKPLKAITLFCVAGDPAERSSLEAYLRAAAARLATDGVQISTSVDVGDTRHVIERAAKGRDLVILATHGRGGFDRLRHGSTADFVVHSLDQPVLLVRVAEVPEYALRSEPNQPPPGEVIEAQLH
jgi:nucleotide-binding universal stress UspA family protein